MTDDLISATFTPCFTVVMTSGGVVKGVEIDWESSFNDVYDAPIDVARELGDIAAQFADDISSKITHSAKDIARKHIEGRINQARTELLESLND